MAFADNRSGKSSVFNSALRFAALSGRPESPSS